MTRRLLPLAVISILIVVFAARAVRSTRPVEAAPTAFAFTGTEQTYTVPAGVTRVLVQADGAGGGPSACGVLGGFGQETRALLTVTPGQTLYVEVGGIGATPAGGFNGGGNGGAAGAFSAASGGGGGGGAADVRTISNLNAGSLASRVVTSGGGGGGAGCGSSTSANLGGTGGTAPSGNGNNGQGVGFGSGGIAGLTGGAGGAGNPAGTAGSTGQGGNGAASTSQTFSGGAGGGGGGGITGGGGGGAGDFIAAGPGGGGGGSGSGGLGAGTTPISTGQNPVLAASVIITPLDAVTMTKTFSPASVVVNGTSTMTITITNPNAILGLTGVDVSDTLPAGVRVAATPAVTNTCGGTVAAVAGSGSVSLTNGSIAAAGSCSFTVSVQGITVGVWVNTTGNVTSNEASGGPAVGTLVVTAVPVPTATPSPTPSPTLVPPPVIVVPVPVFQNPAVGGIFNPIAKTPTPRAAVAPALAVDPQLAVPALRPPNTGDAGLRSRLDVPQDE